ncbi:MAG: outer membrane lipoprotein carrier protein LolA [Proteobacteria bacterium]|nr:outer membrane lipoprotein carrier protein LolA [Pseudomonadota bacterium]
MAEAQRVLPVRPLQRFSIARPLFRLALIAACFAGPWASGGADAEQIAQQRAATDGSRIRPQQLNPADKEGVQRIEAYLEQLTTMEARFIQISSNGGYAEGTLYLDRPGRMRINYDPPTPIEIYALRGTLTYFDSKLKQVSYVSVDQTPAGLLLSKNVELQKDAVITGFERGAGTIRVTLVRRSEPGAGSLSLIFADKPLILRKWVVDDAQGVQTGVTLIDTRFGVTLKPDLFEFRDPNFFQKND